MSHVLQTIIYVHIIEGIRARILLWLVKNALKSDLLV